MSTGRTVTDNCEVRAALPEIAATNPYCPRGDEFPDADKVLRRVHNPAAGCPAQCGIPEPAGARILSDQVYSSGEVQGLGRALSGGGRANATVGLIAPGTFYGDRVEQLDLSIAKILRFFGPTRLRIAADIFNALIAARFWSRTAPTPTSGDRTRLLRPGSSVLRAAQLLGGVTDASRAAAPRRA